VNFSLEISEAKEQRKELLKVTEQFKNLREVQQLEASTKAELYERLQQQLVEKEEELHRVRQGPTASTSNVAGGSGEKVFFITKSSLMIKGETAGRNKSAA
jgi:cell division septation protein DedD